MVLVAVWFLLVASALATSPIRPKSPPIKIPRRPPVEAHCGKDEKYVSNSTSCQVTCANRAFQDSSGGCKPFSGCVCKDDLVRLNDDATGACVTEDQCPPSCPKGESYAKDTNLSEKSCSNRDIYDVMGPCQPYSKCVCSGGLVRLNDDGTGPCVSEDQCPNTRCGPNEIWSKIKITCPPQNCLSLYVLYSCAAPPPDELRPSGCNCIDGYLRNSEDICIPSEECPPLQTLPECTGPNEVPTAQRTICPPQSCERIYTSYACPPRVPEPGCDCKYGYFRNFENICVPSDECPPYPPALPECGVNETYSDDKITCPPQSCEAATGLVHYLCPRDIPEPGCNCKDGFLRDANDVCISAEECPPVKAKCGKNSTFRECTSACPATCKPNLGACSAVCKPPGCECNKGYVLHEGECILPKNCPVQTLPECTGPNEVPTAQRIICPPQSCESIYTSYACQPQAPEPGCDCEDGYLRNSENICVCSEECPPNPPALPECGVNETYSDNKITCPPQSCEAATGLIQYLCALGAPEPGCNCKDGFLRDVNDVCISAEECPPGPGLQIVCGPNEVESDTKIICPPQTCEAIGRQYKCKVTQPKRGCNCIDGYLKDSNGVCIPKKKCPKRTENQPLLCGPNEEESNSKIKCPPQTCESIGLIYRCPAQIPERGCNCIYGYFRNSEGVCIPQDQCPKENLCPNPNEVWDDCPLACPPRKCGINDALVLCAADQPCEPAGCRCQDGYYRNDEGYCVLFDDCQKVEPTPRPHKKSSSSSSTSASSGSQRSSSSHSASSSSSTASSNAQSSSSSSSSSSLSSQSAKTSSSSLSNASTKVKVKCGKNSTFRECTSACPATCKPNLGACIAVCKPPGCECNKGYVLHEGECILAKDCPAGFGQCGKNSTYSECTSACPATCKPSSVACILSCRPPGCVCNEGYVLHDGKCILKSDCPAPVEQCGANSTYKECTSACPETCVPILRPCSAVCKPPGCECNEGYVLHEGKCILKKECPAPVKKCGVNSTYRNCTSACPVTCEPYDGPCPAVCKPPGCQCNKGYVLHKGKCILKKECPVPVKKCGENSTYRNCTSACPATCEPYDGPCPAVCKPPGCQCNKGYVLHKGKCILKKECPVPVKKCGENSTYRNCTSACPATCEPYDGPCPAVCKPPGCQCNKGYVLHKGKCILKKECPAPVEKCGANSTYSECTSACPATCKPSSVACILSCQPPGCACNEGYVLHDGECILKSDCPAPVKKCGKNSTFKDCTSACPATCEQPKPTVCIDMCKPPGCECNEGYVLHEGKCILAGNCPAPVVKCGENSTYKDCTTACPATCEQPKPTVCIDMCKPPGCECNEGYVLHEGKCILAGNCPAPTCPANETYVNCNVGCPNNYCPKSDSRGIIACSPPRPCPPGCACQAGYKRKSREDPTCIKYNECPPVPCTRPHEVWSPAPPNCITDRCNDVLNPTPCNRPYPNYTPQCVCEAGYFRNDGDICVPLLKCPGTSCPANETFVFCKAGCPTDFCPKEEYPPFIACDPPWPCPGGCVCKAGYKRKSETENVCVKISDCAPVTCTKPNEIWTPNPPNCVYERCEDATNPRPCERNYPNYMPQCMCREGYYRNASDICVPKAECPVQCPTPEQCRPTCAVPNPPNCPKSSPAAENVDGCECKAGFVLSEFGGKCVGIQECPQDQGCNGDPFAVPMACPWPCPSSCSSPESSSCGKTCEPVGCTCPSGYILSDNTRKCILAAECPGGDPCGPNGTFVDCGFRCPNQYCPQDDSLVKYACKPGRPCPPGCACNTNYLRKSYEEDVCVLARECPQVECTRDHEEWNPCTTECLAEGCENRFNKQSDCDPELYECQPKCACQKDYFRDSDDNCVLADQCTKPKLCFSKCTPTCAVPNPPNCPQPGGYNEKQCCESGYILDKTGGKCIRIEECPKNVGCNGDPNAVTRGCPKACVPSTCKNPESQYCPAACSPGCECAPGYILSDIKGKCIKVEKCPGGNPCGPNAFFANCKSSCPTDYCPIEDRRGTLICETSPFAPCFAGCVCKLNHKLNNRKEKKCIVSSDCPPVPCTRPCEEWSPCPSACLSEYCEDAGKQPVTCNTLVLNCQPRCICQEGHFRNATDICIPALDCVE